MPESNVQTVLARFAIGLRAASLTEHLAASGVWSVTNTPKWIVKRLPPPKVEVIVFTVDLKRAQELMKGEW